MATRKRERLTAAELVELRPALPDLEAAYQAAEAQMSALREEQEDRRPLINQLQDVDEVFEGVPLTVNGDATVSVRSVGEDAELRWAGVAPTARDEDDGPTGPWLLDLDFPGCWPSRKWLMYADKGAAVLAAKRFAAHGVVPGPPAPTEELPCSND